MQVAIAIYTALFAALFVGTSLAVVLAKLLDKDFDPDSAYDLSYLDELDKEDWDADEPKNANDDKTNDVKATDKEDAKAVCDTENPAASELHHLGDMTF
jgi:ATP-dependent protease Clp ATPase subunit